MAVLDLIRFGHRIQGADGRLIEFLVGGGIKLQGLACLSRFIEKTRVGDGEVHAILDGLPAFHEEGWRFALRAEYLWIANLADRVGRGELNLNLPSIVPARLVFKPQETKRIFGELIQALLDLPVLFPVGEKGRTWNARRERITRSSWFTPNYMGKWFCSNLMEAHSTFSHLALQEFFLSAPKLLFALKRFHRDRGALPDSLDELVPAYLKEIPRDPYDGEKLRYDKERKIVWTAGPDLNFNGIPESEEPGIVDGPALRIGF